MKQHLEQSKWTSVAISRRNYKELEELSGRIIKGVKLTIPQTIKYLTKDGLVRSENSKELLNELTGNNRKII